MLSPLGTRKYDFPINRYQASVSLETYFDNKARLGMVSATS